MWTVVTRWNGSSSRVPDPIIETIKNLKETEVVYLETVEIDGLSDQLSAFTYDVLREDDRFRTIVYSPKRTAFLSKHESEHEALLKILQDALIKIEETDAETAARLAARAYVNLKTDPKGQRRYDGLLHRFTGVLHRSSPS